MLFEIDPRPYQADAGPGRRPSWSGPGRPRRWPRVTSGGPDPLVKAQAISREEYDSRTSAEAQGGASVRAAEAAVQTARLNLEWTRVRSPISGRVSNALVTAGQPGAGRFTDHAAHHRRVAGPDVRLLRQRRADLPPLRRPGPRQRRQLAHGQASGLPRPGQRGRLSPRGAARLRGQSDRSQHRYDPDPRGLLQQVAGADARLFARVKLVGDHKRKALLVRDAAIGTDQDRKFVLVVGPGDTLVYRPVVPGRLVDGLRIIDSGLQPSENGGSEWSDAGPARNEGGSHSSSEMTAADSAAPASAGQGK